MIGENGSIHFQERMKCLDWGCFFIVAVSSVMSSASRSQLNMLSLKRLGSRNTHWLKDLTVAAWTLIHSLKCLEIVNSCKLGRLSSVWKKFLYPSSVILWFIEKSRCLSFWKPPLIATLAISTTLSSSKVLKNWRTWRHWRCWHCWMISLAIWWIPSPVGRINSSRLFKEPKA